MSGASPNKNETQEEGILQQSFDRDSEEPTSSEHPTNKNLNLEMMNQGSSIRLLALTPVLDNIRETASNYDESQLGDAVDIKK